MTGNTKPFSSAIRRFSQRKRPLFRSCERSVYETLTDIDLSPITQILCQSSQDLLQHPTFAPLLKTSMTGLVRRESIRQIFPARPGAQNPEHAIEDFSISATRPSAAGLPREQRCNQVPLNVLKFFTSRHVRSSERTRKNSIPPTTITQNTFLRSLLVLWKQNVDA